jgi:hypothetical protein
LDPLVLLSQAESGGRIPRSVASRVRKRLPYLVGATQRVEKASGLDYPPYYVEPALPLAQSSVEYGQTGVLYARVIPATSEGRLSIIVQFAAALIAFGSKGTIEAVAAHEFTHYVDLIRRFKEMNIVSDESSFTLFEAGYADAERIMSPKALFQDRPLLSLLKRKFKDNLVDERLNSAVESKWLEKSLPTRLVRPDENVVRVQIRSIVSTNFDPRVLQKIREIEERTKT